MLNLMNRICRSPADATGAGAAEAGSGDAAAAATAAAATAAAAAAAAATGGGGDKATGDALLSAGGAALPVKPEWATGMSDDSWKSVAANDYKSLDDVISAHNNHQAKIGSDKFVVPGENSTTEDWDAAYTALGRPAEAKLYEIPMPEGFEPTESDVAFHDSFKNKAHELGLNQKQLSGLAEWNNEHLAKAAVDLEAVQSAESEKTKASLRQHFGAEADNKLEAANAFLKNIGGDEVSAMFAKSDLSRNFPVVDFIIKMAEMASGEGGLVGGGGGGGGSPSLDAQIKTAMSDPVYNNPRDASHKELRARVGKMRKILNESKS